MVPITLPYWGTEIRRGFLPAATFNAHWLAHSVLHDAVGGFVAQESREKEAAMRMLAERSPFAEAQR